VRGKRQVEAGGVSSIGPEYREWKEWKEFWKDYAKEYARVVSSTQADAP
jgi:hypothetical protein